MATLARELRRELERTVKQARRVAEAGAHKAIDRLGVGDATPPAGLSRAGHSLRERLRAHGRQLGDRRDARRGTQVTARLVAECAYEHWHRMLFARFLAENDLLIEPNHGVAITLDECKELARAQREDWLTVASSYAVGMLPQIFRPGDPVLDVSLPPETWSELEDLLKGVPAEVFKADDSLGWVYQFWQAERKEEVNASEGKIGADELPAVTQLFTEDYMVLFLLHNTLGAWWAGKVLAARPELATPASEEELRAACAVGDVTWTYLRFVRDPLPSPASGRGDDGEDNKLPSPSGRGAGGEGFWRPAAGTFDGWPKTAREITVLDPCMGSGHFLVFALPILVAFRMAEEGLTRPEAVFAVLRDNLFGLEIDSRCTQIAAFNLALAAWRMVGHRPLPPLQLACSGLSLGVTKGEWLRLAEKASPLPPDRDLFGTTHNLFSQQVQGGLEALYEVFEKGPWLGSLIDPRRAGASLLEAGYEQIEPLLVPLLATPASAEISEMAVTAQGLSKAAELLARRFTLVATNVPYLGRGKQGDEIRDYCEGVFPLAKTDLATCFVERCISSCETGGSAALVSPQNWLFLPGYKALRDSLLRQQSWCVVARLGANAFQDMNFWAATTALTIISKLAPSSQQFLYLIDVSSDKDRAKKSDMLSGRLESQNRTVKQAGQLENPDARISFESLEGVSLLNEYAEAPQGIKTGDDSRFRRQFWEVTQLVTRWRPIQGASSRTGWISGLDSAVDWQSEGADFARLQGMSGWGKLGVVLKLMGQVQTTLHIGAVFDSNVTVVVPKDRSLLPAIWSYCSSPEYGLHLKAAEQSAKANNATTTKVPFDRSTWVKIASAKYPEGLPNPHSDDPTQWLFSGHPKGSEQPLQVAVARLVGYRWPRQTGNEFPDCPSLGADGLESHADTDGIVCLASIKGEPAAAERVNSLLSAAFGSKWSAGKLDSLLTEAGFGGKSLDLWLRDAFFANHCDVFHQRPFVWHIWDGRQDGFHALVNYHRLAAPNGEGRRTLEKLIYTYLGDWIERQRQEQRSGVDGADARLAAAEYLKMELEKILVGEPPYDIFVRWKPLGQQPIGWEPDINDGVRLNIRPFMTARPLGARAASACILRTTPRIKWDKDRGKEPKRPKEDYPWFWGWDEETTDFAGGRTFDGNRFNGLHYTTAFKQAARDRQASQAAQEGKQ